MSKENLLILEDSWNYKNIEHKLKLLKRFITKNFAKINTIKIYYKNIICIVLNEEISSEEIIKLIKIYKKAILDLIKKCPDIQKKEKKKYRENKLNMENLPIDIIIPNIPHWSIVKELKFSSLEKLQEQLGIWNIPYQIVKFSKGKNIINSLNANEVTEVQIALSVNEDWKKNQYLIVDRHYDTNRYDDISISNKQVFSFSLNFGLNKEQKTVIVNEINGTEEFKEIVWIKNLEKEITLPTKGIIWIDYENLKIKNKFELVIENYSIVLIQEQKNKLDNINILEIETIIGDSSSELIQKFVTLYLEFPVDNPSNPVLKKIENTGLYI